jgi:hypothetical protein
MTRQLLRLTLLAIASTTLLVACGGEKKAEETTSADAGRGTITCEGSAMSGDAGLPANFPILPEMTLVSAEGKGPTHVVDGYATDGIEGVYREMTDRFQEEQYTILFSEIEKENGDAEISYKSADGMTTGQLALRAACDNDNTSVHITARPA